MNYFDTRGYRQDLTRFFKLLDRIATALEKITEEEDEKEASQ